MFDTIISHDHIKNFVMKELKEDRIPNGFLFTGPQGVGKHLFADELAKILNCTGNEPPCGSCSNCKVLEAGEHPDIVTIDPKANLKLEASKKSSDTVKFRDLIDKIISDSIFRPSLGAKKVVIIDDAGDLSVPAMNNLLKILEEPPDYMVMILISTSERNVLPTIRSRTQQLRFKRLSASSIKEFIGSSKEEADEGSLKMCNGSLGRYYDLSQEQFEKFFRITTQILTTVKSARHVWDINKVAAEIIKKEFKTKTRQYYDEFRHYLDFLKRLCEFTLVKGDLETKEFNRFYDAVSVINVSSKRKMGEDPMFRLDVSGKVAKAIETARSASFRYVNFELLLSEFIRNLGTAFRGIS